MIIRKQILQLHCILRMTDISRLSCTIHWRRTMINDTHLVEIDDFTNYEETFQKPVMTGRVSLVPSEDLWKTSWIYLRNSLTRTWRKDRRIPDHKETISAITIWWGGERGGRSFRHRCSDTTSLKINERSILNIEFFLDLKFYLKRREGEEESKSNSLKRRGINSRWSKLLIR